MRIADTRDLKKLNRRLKDGKKIALIGFDINEEFENADKLGYIPDLFDDDNPCKDLEVVLKELYDNYSGVVIVSDRRRITNFKIPCVQLIPKDINVELETVAVLNRSQLTDSIRKFLRVNNILDQSLNTLYLSELSMANKGKDSASIPLEDVIMQSFDFTKIESLEKHRRENPRNKESERFRNYIIEPFPIEKYNLIAAYRENDRLKSSKNVSVRVIDKKDLRDFDLSSRLKQVFLIEEDNVKKLRDLNVPEYLDFCVITDDDTKEEKLLKAIDFGKRGYEIVLIEQEGVSNRILADLIRLLNLYTERFNIDFSKSVSYLSRLGIPNDTEVEEINCNTKDRNVLYETVRQAVRDGKFVSLTNLPEDENFFLIRIWNRIRHYLTYNTPIALYFPEAVVITNFGLLSEDINQLYQANRIVIANNKAERTRIDRFILLDD